MISIEFVPSEKLRFPFISFKIFGKIDFDFPDGTESPEKMSDRWPIFLSALEIKPSIVVFDSETKNM